MSSSLRGRIRQERTAGRTGRDPGRCRDQTPNFAAQRKFALWKTCGKPVENLWKTCGKREEPEKNRAGFFKVFSKFFQSFSEKQGRFLNGETWTRTLLNV